MPDLLEGRIGTTKMPCAAPLRLLASALGVGALLAASAGAAEPIRTSNLLGYVVDEESGRPIATAEVRTAAAESPAITNAAGVFIFKDLPAGPHVLRVTHIGYADGTVEVDLYTDENHEIVIRLGPSPIEIQGLEVAVVPRRLFNDMDGLARRIESGLGDFVLRDEIDQRGGNVATLIQSLPGVSIKTTGSAFSGMFAVLRNARDMRSGAVGTIEFVDCHPAVFVDGRRWSRRAEIGDEPFDLTELSSMDLEAVEVYGGAGSVPGEYGGGDAACGAIIVWTRRGATRFLRGGR